MKNEIIKMMVPAVGESINEVTISAWLKKDGDIVELDEIIAEIDSDKATFDLTAESSGKLKIQAQEGDTIKVGAHICSIEEGVFKKEKKSEVEQGTPINNKTEKKDKNKTTEKLNITPVAQKIIEEKGLDISNVSGTGIGGKITKEDVLDINQNSPKKVQKKI